MCQLGQFVRYLRNLAEDIFLRKVESGGSWEVQLKL